MTDNLAQQIERVGAQLAQAQVVACMTGAGISAESGVATFRGGGGLWEGHRVEDVATPQAFARDPELVWRFYQMRREGLLTCRPNPAHIALAELEQRCPRFDLITQNVDGLHQAAGSRNVTALHGDIWIDRCTACTHEQRAVGVVADMPRCASCGALARPGIVWFGEMLPPGALEHAAEAVSAADVMLVIGTSSVVQPAASLALMAKSTGAVVVEINLEPTPLSASADVTLLGQAGEIMPQIVAAMSQ